MQSNNSPLPKWPFYLGNVLLVLTAVLLAFQSGSQLTTGQFFWCFMCVGLGAVLFALPYILEYQGQVKIQSTQGSTNYGTQLSRIENNLNTLLDASDTAAQQDQKQSMSQTMLEAVVTQVQDKVNELSTTLSSSENLEQLSANLEQLAQATSETQPAQTAHLENAISSVQSQLSQMQEAIHNTSAQEPITTTDNTEVLERLETISSVLYTIKNTVETQSMRAAAQSTPVTTTARAAMEASAIAQSSKTTKNIHELLNETHSLVNEVESAANTQTDTQTQTVAVAPQVTTEAASHVSTGPSNLDDLVEQNLASSGSLSISLDGDTSSETSDTKNADIFSNLEVLKTETQTQQEEPTAPSAQAAEETQSPAPSTMSYMETLLTEDDSSTGSVSNQDHLEGQGTTLIVNALPGLGKRPFIRGQGPGLNWEHGIPLEFVETGKWQWSSPDSSQPVICRIYKDDETPAEGEVIALQPGEQVETTPTFKG